MSSHAQESEKVSMQHKIAIIGAGPAGLCLGNILQRNGVPFTIYEADHSPNERNQGGMLDIHPKFGQLAIKDAGVWDEFVKHARPEADVMKIVEQKSGKVLWDGNEADKIEIQKGHEFDHRPEIDRGDLTKMFYDPLLKTGRVVFGRRLDRLEKQRDGKYTLFWKEGEPIIDVDLVVGADGAWSHVRREITSVMPHYSGVSAVEFWAEHAAEKHRFVYDYVGAGSCFAFDEGRSVQCQRLGEGTVRIYGGLRCPEKFFQNLRFDVETNPTKYVEEFFGDIAPELKRLMLDSTDKVVKRPLYMLPVGFRWESKPGVTVIGDAAHVMTPAAGVGVNAALADAQSLATLLTTQFSAGDCGDFASIVAKYEQDMFPRAEAFAIRTYQGLINHFSKDGSAEFAEHYRASIMSH